MNRAFHFMVLLFFFLIPFTKAQYTDSIFQDQIIIDPANKNNLSLKITNANFVRNNEYFAPFAEGYTLIGYFIQPELKFQPGEKTMFSAGIHFLKYSGLEHFSQYLPAFSFHYKPGKHFTFILGTLQGSLNHQMEDHMLSFEKYYTHNLENGTQFLFNFNNFRSDLWVNWEQFITKGDPFRERLVFGTSSEISFNNSDNSLRALIPLQTLMIHKGGQIDSSPLPVETYLNSATGLDISIKTSTEKVIGFRTLFSTFNDLTKKEIYPYQKGTAFYFKTYLETNRTDFSLGYWKGNRFITPKGNPLFSSVYKKTGNTGDPSRDIFTAFIAYHIELDDFVRFILQGESYYDIERSIFDYSFGLHVLFKQEFFLRNVKNIASHSN
ncbi:MAG: hypothetical protein IMY71_12830 [Bacteroidetes bacterium]|nr:hypothetical protein [Bacteroidota bacterium]